MGSKRFLIFLIPFFIIAVACDRVANEALSDEMAHFNAWVKINHIIPDSITPLGLYYINRQAGTGISPADSNYLLYTLTRRNLDGDVSETTFKDTAKLWNLFAYSTHYTPDYTLFTVKAAKSYGLLNGLYLMKEGGKARLIMPPGTESSNSLSTSIYDIELKKVVTDPKAYEKELIQQYMLSNPGFTSFNSDSIYYKKTENGSKDVVVTNGTTVRVKYTGRFIMDGYVFDTNIDTVAKANRIYNSTTTNYDTTLTFVVGSTTVIPGFNLAVKKMIGFERATFIIPSESAYGVTGKTGIPPYSPLIFEIQLRTTTPKTSN